MDGFSIVLPLPFRIFTLIVGGVFGWGLVLQILTGFGINTLALVRHTPRGSPAEHLHYHLTYRLATILAAPLAALLLIFWLGARFDAERVPNWSTAANLYLVILALIILLQPGPAKTGTRRVLQTLARVIVGGLAKDPNVKFGDVLMSDALVSYSKVFGDMAVVACMALTVSSTAMPERSCGGFWPVPLMQSYPTLIRIAQTLTEFHRSRASRAPLFNCLKYATNLPVIWLGAWINYPSDAAPSPALVSLWWLAVVVNSTYSFYWDVAMDWDLRLPADALAALTCGRPASPFGLRDDLRLWSQPGAYYAAVAADFVLRFTWGLKFSPRLDRLARLEGGIFLFEAAEVFRRGMWCVLRVEAQDVRENGSRLEGALELS